MNVHKILFPVLLVVGITECSLLNLRAAGWSLGPEGERALQMAFGTPAGPAMPEASAAPGADSTSIPDRPVPDEPVAEAAGPSASASASAAVDSDTAPPGNQIPFRPRSALFEPKARTLMFEIARELKKDPDRKLRLVGHSDTTTDRDRADGIGERRARGVYDFIIQLDVSPSQLQFEVADPTTSDDPATSARHRGVDLIWE